MIDFLNAVGNDAYDLDPLRDGWYLQRDTTSYAYSAGGSSEQPRLVGAERLATLLTQAKRYRDM